MKLPGKNHRGAQLKKCLIVCVIFLSGIGICTAQKLSQNNPPLALKSYTSPLTIEKPLVGKKTAYSVPGNFYASNLAFFCRQELKLEAATKIPFRFRLGSVEACDRLEGKRK